MAWLAKSRERFDVAFVAPPTHSTSKRAALFDVQDDHLRLLERVRARMAPGGVIVFSTHSRKFKLDGAALQKLGISAEDITHRTLPPDFARDKRFHYTWLLR
jgi:23S rRNA (guanine2445-N2)-methyltransferase / 23S rRNA (guanine2069-N7)-methyltransferase